MFTYISHIIFISKYLEIRGFNFLCCSYGPVEWVNANAGVGTWEVLLAIVVSIIAILSWAPFIIFGIKTLCIWHTGRFGIWHNYINRYWTSCDAFVAKSYEGNLFVSSCLPVSSHVGFWQLENDHVDSEVRYSDITVTHEHREYCAGCPMSHCAPTYFTTCICVVARQYYIRKVPVILNDNLPQSHDCSRQVRRRILAPPLLRLQKHTDLRAHDFAHSPDLRHHSRVTKRTYAWSWRLCGYHPAIRWVTLSVQVRWRVVYSILCTYERR